MKHLTPSEAKQYASERMHAKLREAYDGLPAVSEFVAAALAGAAKRGWYKHARKAIEARYGADSVRFAAVLASLSPRVAVAMNVHNAVNVFDLWVARGRPHDESAILAIMREAIKGQLLHAWVPNTVRALSLVENGDGIELSGAKVASFAANLSGDMYAVTVDAWMITFAGVSDRKVRGTLRKSGLSKSPTYVAISVKVREAARKLGWTPAEVQECIWSFTKVATEAAANQRTTIVELVRAGSLTAELINNVADVHSLFGARTYADAFAPQGLNSRALLRVAKRLDNARDPVPF